MVCHAVYAEGVMAAIPDEEEAKKKGETKEDREKREKAKAAKEKADREKGTRQPWIAMQLLGCRYILI